MTTLQPPDLRSPLAIDPRAGVCMDAYMRLLRLSEDLTQAILAELGDRLLSRNMPFIVLLGLYLDGPMRPSAIATLTGLSSGGVSGALERMESLDLIAREFGLVPGDRRGVVVRLTETGHRDVLVIARVLDDLVDGLLRDLGRVIEQRERQGVPATPTAPTNAQGPGATTIERPQGSDPAAELRDRSRENMDVFLRIATAGETIKQASVGVFEELEFALNVPQMALYGLLVHGSLRPTEIAALTGLTSGGVSGLLDRLEAVGLITRDFGLVPGDRRAVTVRLTEKASKGMLVVVEMRTEPVERLLDDLTPLIEARAQRAAGAKPAI